MDLRTFLYPVLLILTVVVLSKLQYFWGYVVFEPEAYNAFSQSKKLLLVQVPALIISLFTALAFSNFKVRDWLEQLGLHKGLGMGVVGALVVCLPMLIGNGWMNDWNITDDYEGLFWGSFWAGLNEELIYRGILFGFMIRKFKLNFWIAIIIPAILFGYGHVYQAETTGQAISVFAFTALASIGFCMFYLMWNWNLWFLITLHILMDFAWEFFVVEANVLGNGNANIFRFITLGMAIGLSIWRMRRSGIPFKTLMAGGEE